MKLVEAINASGEVKPLETLLDEPTFLFSAIGNSDGFEQTLLQQSANIVGHETFADHHCFDREDIERIGKAAKQSAAKQIVCTHKDLVKIGVDRIAELPVHAALIAVEFTAGLETLTNALTSCLTKKASDLSQGR